MCVFIFSVASTRNILGAFLKVVTLLTLLVIDLVIYLCVLVISTLISLFGFSKLMGPHVAVIRVYPILFSQFPFLVIFLFLGVSAEILPG